MKLCTKCNTKKDLSEFGKKTNNQDGLQTWCKLCTRISSYTYYRANKEKVKEYQREYYKKNREKIKEYVKQYWDKNRDKKRAYDKKYNEENKEKRKIYNEKNKQKQKQHRIECRKKWIKILKANNFHQCRECGYNNCFSAIDFHHVYEKEFSISNFIGNRTPTKERIQKVLNELQKCIPLCSNCHRETHATEGVNYDIES